jgi:hypothetical protein
MNTDGTEDITDYESSMIPEIAEAVHSAVKEG